MRESVRLGTIAGVRVGLNASALVIIAILVVGLAVGRFPAAFPGRGVVAYIVAAVVAAALFFASLLAHEISHAVVARRNGIDVEGIVLWLFGGVAQLKGEPRSPGADFRIAAVGPLTSLVVAALSAGVAGVLLALGGSGLPVGIFGYIAVVNVLLAVFNLVPAAPLDGGRILRAVLWRWRGDRVRAAVAAARAGRVFGYVLVALGIAQVVAGEGFGGLWLALIGVFLVNAAMAEEQQSRVSQTLHGIRVADVMSPGPVTADPHETLDRFVAETAWQGRHSAYPLVDEAGRISGLVTLNRVRGVPADRRANVTLAEVACRPEELPLTSTDEQLVDLLPRMAPCSDGRAVVVDEASRVVGIVSPSDISRVMQLSDLRSFDPYRGSGGGDLSSTSGSRA